MILGAMTGIAFVALTSCGGHGLCDAFHKADYTKHKAEKTKKIELNIRKK